MKYIVRQLIRRTGFDIVRYRSAPPKAASPVEVKPVFPPDFDPEAIEIIQAVQPYTMTSIERIFALIQAVKYIVQANIPGDIVECGVWRGGQYDGGCTHTQASRPRQDEPPSLRHLS
jgi:O-methyltransferase